MLKPVYADSYFCRNRDTLQFKGLRQDKKKLIILIHQSHVKFIKMESKNTYKIILHAVH